MAGGQVLARVRRKAAMFGREYTADESQHDGATESLKIDPDRVAEMFETWVMPLTKDVEVAYLLRRLEWSE